MKAVAVVPARMGSSRFPGKPIANILGRPMIEHVYRRVAMSGAVGEVYIATCDAEIREVAEGFGAPVAMTADTHERASDRVAEAAERIDADLIVLVQGDEPMVVPEMIDAAVAPFRDEPGLGCVNLAKRIDGEAEFRDPNTIKVVMDDRGDALYMSRQPIPTLGDGWDTGAAVFKQVCIIPFRREILTRYARLDPTPLEILESIDMLRFLEHGMKVRMVETVHETRAVDTPEDLKRVEAMMDGDALVSTY